MRAPTPISTPATTSKAALPVGRNTSSATPAMTKAIWVTAPTVVSTTMLAAACGPGTPRRWARRALAISPPILATGNSELIDSRIHRIQATLTTSGRVSRGSSSRHERAEKSIGTM